MEGLDASKIEQLLTLHEGRRSKPYKDSVGKWSIGIGRNLTDVGLYPDEIDYLFHNDIMHCLKSLRMHLPFFDALDETRKLVLLDMCFNLGIGRLLGFKKALDAMQWGNYDTAATEMLDSLWAKQVGQRAIRLAQMMRTGELPGEITSGAV